MTSARSLLRLTGRGMLESEKDLIEGMTRVRLSCWSPKASGSVSIALEQEELGLAAQLLSEARSIASTRPELAGYEEVI